MLRRKRPRHVLVCLDKEHASCAESSCELGDATTRFDRQRETVRNDHDVEPVVQGVLANTHQCAPQLAPSRGRVDSPRRRRHDREPSTAESSSDSRDLSDTSRRTERRRTRVWIASRNTATFPAVKPCRTVIACSDASQSSPSRTRNVTAAASSIVTGSDRTSGASPPSLTSTKGSPLACRIPPRNALLTRVVTRHPRSSAAILRVFSANGLLSPRPSCWGPGPAA